MHSLAINITEHREALGLSQAQLARLVGVSRATLSRWESGEFGPSRSNLELLAAALHTTSSSLHGGAPEAQEINARLLGAALEGLEMALGNRFSALPAHQRAKLVAYVYTKGGQISQPEARALVELLK